MTYDEPRLEEQVLSKIAEIGISSQIDDAQTIDVDVKTDLLKVVQGQADSVAIATEGLVIQKDIRVQQMELQADNIDINPWSAIFGQIKLDQPLDATARIVLIEEDINRTLNSEYILSKMQTELDADGEKVGVAMQQMQLQLPGDNKMIFSGKAVLQEAGKNRQVGFNATARPRTATQPVMLEGFNCTEGEGISLEFTVSLMQKMKELVNAAYLELETMALRVERMEVHQGSLTLQAQAHVRQIPTT